MLQRPKKGWSKEEVGAPTSCTRLRSDTLPERKGTNFRWQDLEINRISFMKIETFAAVIIGDLKELTPLYHHSFFFVFPWHFQQTLTSNVVKRNFGRAFMNVEWMELWDLWISTIEINYVLCVCILNVDLLSKSLDVSNHSYIHFCSRIVIINSTFSKMGLLVICYWLVI